MTAEQKGKLAEVAWIDPERMSGTPCFTGTRVPVPSLADYIKAVRGCWDPLTDAA